MADQVDRTRQIGIVILDAVVMGIVVLTVVLRFIARQFIVKKLGADDWLMLAATFFTCLHCIGDIVSCKHGLGLHVTDIDPSWISMLLKLLTFEEIAYHLSSFFVKISVLVFYLQLFGMASGPRRVAWSMIVFLTAYTASTIVTLLLQCQPLTKAWGSTEPGICIDLEAFIYFGAAVNTVTDLIIFVLPLSTIVTMKLSKADKLLLVGVFSLSLMACIMGCVRLSTIKTFFKSKDFSWNLFDLFIWSQVEIATGVVCCSAPALKPLFVRKKPSTPSADLPAPVRIKKSSYGNADSLRSDKKWGSQVITELDFGKIETSETQEGYQIECLKCSQS